MTKPLRKQMKRKAAQAVQHSQRICENMMFIREQFIDGHPDWIDLFDLIINNQLMQISFIKVLSTKAWGQFPDNLDTWLK